MSILIHCLCHNREDMMLFMAVGMCGCYFHIFNQEARLAWEKGCDHITYSRPPVVYVCQIGSMTQRFHNFPKQGSQWGTSTKCSNMGAFGRTFHIQTIAQPHWALEMSLVCLKHRVLFLNYFWRFIYFYFLCIGVLHACISMYHMYAWCPRRPEEGTRSLGTEVKDSR